ncbi:Intersectin-1 [Eumeta japonica]|uniref:Intersectin-1 n=1 Tax=Eumeta variegata TaxID=151549 RepID=A0A4C1XRS6_EUMVA|nr:Intersectin-1 [Eumeta japonica]
MGDPWVIQPHEHAKFAEHFRNLNPINGMVTGEQAKRFMLQSQLPPPILGQIWSLADTNADGKLDLKEFSIACKIINLKLHGIEIPKSLPPSLIASLSPTGAAKSIPSLPQAQQIRPPIPPMPVVPPQSFNSAMTQSSTSLLGDFTSPPKPQQVLPSQPLVSGQQVIPPVANQPIIPPALNQPLIPPPSSQSMIPPASSHPIIPPVTSQSIIPGQPLVPSVPSQSMVPPISGQPLIPPISSQPIIPPISSQPIIPPISSQPIIPPISNQSAMPFAPSQPIVPSGPTLVSQNSIPDLLAGQTTQAMAASSAAMNVQEAGLLGSPPKSILAMNGGSVVTSTPIMKNEDIIKPGILSPSQDVPLGVVSPPPSMEWGIPQSQKLKYTQLFNSTDRTKSGSVSGAQARSIMLQSRLPQQALAQIWALADLDNDGKLGCEEFVLAMYLCEKATQGEPVPSKLPPELVPPTFRRDSTSSMHSSSSYEEKRRENMARGQAELERRRTALADAQMKEKAERERKEREEAEKREKLRLEAQKREQEELLRKQKEEQEKREAARKEMERQCQLEWEKKRIRELEAMRTEEQSKVLSLKAKSQLLSGQLGAATLRAAELAKDIRETRTAVAQAKATIDGMRSDRDSSVGEMSQLKARVKELNAKQIALNKEKADFDSKAKMEGSEDGKLNMMEVTLKQLKDKLEVAKAIVESKKTDLAQNDQQLSEMTAKVSELMVKCETVWKMYEEKRQEYVDKRSTAPAESAWGAATESEWGTSEEAWGEPAASSWGDAPASAGECASGGNPSVENSVNVSVVAGTEWVGAGGARWRCVYEFAARTADELSLQPGDLVYEATAPRADAEPGWRWGTARGQSGWFPESYVEEVSAAAAPAPIAAAGPVDSKTQLEGTSYPSMHSSRGSSLNFRLLWKQADCRNVLAGIAEMPEPEVVSELASAIPTVEGGDYYVAAYSYTSVEPGDLMFDAGERIEVIRRDGDWWTGRIGNRTGIFPSNYVTKEAVAAEAAATPAAATPAVATPTAVVATAIPEEPQTTEATENGASFAEEPAPVAAPAASATPPPLVGRVQQVAGQEPKSSTPVSSEVAAITEGAGAAGAAGGAARPASGARRDSGRDSVTGGRKKHEIAQALANYTATSSEQLSLVKGQLLVVRKKADSGWWEGELQAKGRNRQVGWFPASYVKLLQSSGRTSGRTTPVLSKMDTMPSDTVIDKIRTSLGIGMSQVRQLHEHSAVRKLCTMDPKLKNSVMLIGAAKCCKICRWTLWSRLQVLALYPYTAQNADELSFEKDDIIAVTDRSQDPAWWQGAYRSDRASWCR